ncbi:MAG: iron hydrogenase [Clostridia bacterium]|nr:iron hydrogenase [Clostridia bacterium]
MKTFEELYHEVTSSAVKGNMTKTLKKLKQEGYSDNQLACLLRPEECAPVFKFNKCGCSDGKCVASCLFQAITNNDGEIFIDKGKCVGCMKCVDSCEEGNIVITHDTLSVINILRQKKRAVFALIAPAYMGQFGKNITSGQVRTALKTIGFTGMVEVAIFADILTFKEALEFDHNIKNEDDYQLTSCCCPVWISMIRKKYPEIATHLSKSVSPMIAAGRIIKELYKDAYTVFIGPCLAKKSEAREEDVKGAVDYVLTFKELQDIFDGANIDISSLEGEEMEHSSYAGRIYAKAGGVSKAVTDTLSRIDEKKAKEIKTTCASGVKECMALLNDIEVGKREFNFFEGMGCKGGCIGGPKALKKEEETIEKIESYAEHSAYPTPLDNPYVIELLHRLGFENIPEFIEKSHILSREF